MRALGGAIASVLTLFCAASACAAPPLFYAGAAAKSIDPPVPVYSGGFSLSPPIKKLRDPLQVRAFYVSNGHRAIAFVVIDAQGYFSGYDEGPDFGATADRADAARAATHVSGIPMTQADLIVQASHTHAGPTLEGIWGPVPVRYLKLVHDQIVAAVSQAAHTARPAYLQFATLADPNIAGVNINQDNYQGWVNDPQLSILRAVRPRDGSTIGLFANVPTHGAHICGECLSILSADYFGSVRARLDRALGGVSVVGPASLGRLESPVETTGPQNMEWLSGVIANDLLQALGHAHWITSTTIAAHETTVQIPATNAALLALNDAWSLSDAQKEQEAQASGIYPIDRADRLPFRAGNLLGSWLTALRLGDVGYLSMPGEPFPEVRLTIAQSVSARTVVALSKGQDDFGYFYPSYDYVFPEVYDSDHAVFNVAPQAGDQVVLGQVANLQTIGFKTTAPVERPLNNDYYEKLKPGLQTLASPPTGDSGPSGRFTTTLQAIYMPGSVRNAPLAGKVHWAFGDGTHAATGYLSVGQDFGQTGQGNHGRALFTHSFRPGSYRVTATAHDTDGNAVSWTIIVRAFPRLIVHAGCDIERSGRATMGATARGGEGAVLRWLWRFSDGGSASGTRAAHFFRAGGGSALVTAVDAAGGTSSAHVKCT